MHALIVFSHPAPDSFTHAVAAQVGAGVADSGHTFEVADLTAEGFDPRFNLHDVRAFQLKEPVPEDVAREHARLGRAKALILVYPVYWWSMPAMLKGWIDRVFSNGWAYAETADAGVDKKLQHLDIHLIAIGGADEKSYQKRGYDVAMKTQIDIGIFDFCGAPVRTSEFLSLPDLPNLDDVLERMRSLGSGLFV
jgi:NAD(P)H dehydrogenase (quinone)